MTRLMRTFVCCAGLLGLWPVSACAGRQVAVGKGVPAGDIDACMALTTKKHFEEAVECLEIYKSRHRGTESGQTADVLIGDNFFANKENLLAAESYEAFLRSFPDHPKADYAAYRLGLAYFLEAPKQIDRDQQYLEHAVQALSTHTGHYPRSAYAGEVKTSLEDAHQRIGQREYYIGRFYYRTGEYRAAIPRLLHVLTDYPHAAERDWLYGQLVRATAALGDLDGARQIYSQMQQELPNHPATNKAQKFLLRAVQRSETPHG